MHFLLNQLVDLAIFFVMAASATLSCIMQEQYSSTATCLIIPVIWEYMTYEIV